MKTIYDYQPVDLCIENDAHAPGIVCRRHGKAAKGEPSTVYAVMNYKTESDAIKAFFGETDLKDNRTRVNV